MELLSRLKDDALLKNHDSFHHIFLKSIVCLLRKGLTLDSKCRILDACERKGGVCFYLDSHSFGPSSRPALYPSCQLYNRDDVSLARVVWF